MSQFSRSLFKRRFNSYFRSFIIKRGFRTLQISTRLLIYQRRQLRIYQRILQRLQQSSLNYCFSKRIRPKMSSQSSQRGLPLIKQLSCLVAYDFIKNNLPTIIVTSLKVLISIRRCFRSAIKRAYNKVDQMDTSSRDF